MTDQGTIQLYNAQIATAKLTSSLAGGVLSIISVLMLIFYIKLYIDSHSAQLGIVKALGYSRGKIASKFWVFGLSVFAGCAVGFGLAWAIMKTIYKNMTIEGVEEITANFHIELLLHWLFYRRCFLSRFHVYTRISRLSVLFFNSLRADNRKLR